MARSLFTKITQLFRRDAAIPQKREATLAVVCFVFAATILSFLSLNLILSGIIFLIGGHLVVWLEVLPLCGALICGYCCARANLTQPLLKFFLICVAIFVIVDGVVVLNRGVYDISYDGQTYQQEAVIQLSQGWNPIYQNLASSLIGPDNKWINYYPKSSWINEASLYLVTHQEETAKALNIILMIVSLALVYTALTDARWLGKVPAGIISVLIAFNPVSVYQSLSFYLDGQLMSLFIALCALFLIIISRRRPFALLLFFLTLIIFINLKFTALVDGILLVVIFAIIAWMKENERLTAKLFLAGGAAVVLGVVLVGFSPYITNVIRYDTPFYPLAGANAVDLKPFNVPGNFIDKNSLEIFFLSFFSRSGGARGVGTTSVYKVPFTYSTDELAAFRYTDPEEGGFGPLFGGILIVEALLLLFYYLVVRFWKKDVVALHRCQIAVTLMIVVVILCVIDPISSLARYVPQAYLLAIIPVVLFLATRQAWTRLAGYALIVLLFFNVALIATSYVGYNLQSSATIAHDLVEFAQMSRQKPLLVLFNEFKSNRIMLQEAGVTYTTTNDQNACASFQRVLPENTTEFCLPPGWH